jgi:hypothetical protein
VLQPQQLNRRFLIFRWLLTNMGRVGEVVSHCIDPNRIDGGEIRKKMKTGALCWFRTRKKLPRLHGKIYDWLPIIAFHKMCSILYVNFVMTVPVDRPVTSLVSIRNGGLNRRPSQIDTTETKRRCNWDQLSSSSICRLFFSFRRWKNLESDWNL